MEIIEAEACPDHIHMPISILPKHSVSQIDVYKRQELLDRIIAELHLEEFPDIRNKLYDLAAKERKDVPADIKEYLMENESILKIIRTAKESPNEKQIWAKVSQII